MLEEAKDKIVIGICGDPDSGKSIISSFFRYLLPKNQRYYIEASVDGDGTVGDSPDQGFMKTIRKIGNLDKFLSEKVKTIIENTESEIVIVDIGGLPTLENAQILSCCDYCVLINKTKEGTQRWRDFIESLKPGREVKYVERIGRPISEEDEILPEENIRVSEKNGIKYRISDQIQIKPYEEISLGGKSPKIALEITSQKSNPNFEVENSIVEENGVIKATLVDLEKGEAAKIKSSINLKGKTKELKLDYDDRDVIITTALMYFKMLKNICRERDMSFGFKKDLLLNRTSNIHEKQIIEDLKKDLERINFLIFGNTNIPQSLGIAKLKDSIQSRLLSIKKCFTFDEKGIGEGIIDFGSIATLLTNSEWIDDFDIKKLIFIYDAFLDTKKNGGEASLYGSRMLISSAAFVEEAIKDGISCIKLHSSTYNRYVECKKLPKIEQKEFGTTINGITYYVEKNDEYKSALIHMNFSNSLKPENLDSIALPDIPADYKICFSGIIPDWFIGSLTMSYENLDKSLLKPDSRGREHIITYASSNISEIGKKEENPPGIDLKSFFDRIPSSKSVFKEFDD